MFVDMGVVSRKYKTPLPEFRNASMAPKPGWKVACVCAFEGLDQPDTSKGRLFRRYPRENQAFGQIRHERNPQTNSLQSWKYMPTNRLEPRPAVTVGSRA